LLFAIFLSSSQKEGEPETPSTVVDRLTMAVGNQPLAIGVCPDVVLAEPS